MEVVGAVSSFIAISQALVAGRHIVNVLRDIPKIGGEIQSLDFEIQSLQAAVKAAEKQQSISHGCDAETPDLRLAKERLEKSVEGLQNLHRRFTRTDQDSKVKARKTKYLFLQKDLADCRDKIRDARDAMHLVLMNMNLEETTRMALRVESLTIQSTGHIPRVGGCSRNMAPNPFLNSDQALPESVGQLTSVAQELTSKVQTRPIEDGMGFKAKLSMANKCSRSCLCRCHASKQSSFGYGGWAGNILGSFSVTSDSSILFRNGTKCSESSCKGNQKTSITVKYKFPTWLWSQGFSFQSTRDSLSAPSASLRPIRTLADGATIWHIIQDQSRAEVQQSIIRKGNIYPDDCDSNGLTLLEWAITAGTPDVLEFLVQFWDGEIAKTHINRNWAFKAQSQLTGRPHMTSQEYQAQHKIVQLGEDTVQAVQTPLHQAATLIGDEEIIRESVQQAFNQYSWAINEWNYEGQTPLHVGASHGNIVAVRELIRLGSEFDQLNFFGRTPLMEAIDMGHIHVARCLLGAGCSVNAIASDGSTALHCAACPENEPEKDPVGIIRVLLDAGINERGGDGDTPLFRAIRTNQPEVAKYLLKAGAEINSPQGLEGSILNVTAAYGEIEVLRSLSKMNLPQIRADMKDSDGDTAWDLFVGTLHQPEWKLGSARKPSSEEKEAFECLYTKIRNRNLQHDVDRLEWARQYLVEEDLRGASAAIAQIIKENEEWKKWKAVQTYQAVLVQVRERMWEAAIESVDENVDILKDQISESPWDRWSHYDILATMDSHQFVN
ncbi:ankyrin repeat protein [Colletotrichum kahawae]|uniref:Ankyrin repeat protein n=1 Tax=Colletotrichum kahawae TaxID=34407 RepID=A0AAD9YB53_COLKA|nr:ankyrin repeat protein [Colletotrichum kahawae]